MVYKREIIKTSPCGRCEVQRLVLCLVINLVTAFPTYDIRFEHHRFLRAYR